jgi:hypothetical protein
MLLPLPALPKTREGKGEVDGGRTSQRDTVWKVQEEVLDLAFQKMCVYEIGAYLCVALLAFF